MTTKEITFGVLAEFVRRTGQRQVVCRPLQSNVPVWEGATLTTCPVCGVACWKTEQEPDELPPHVTAACTSCALKQGMKAR